MVINGFKYYRTISNVNTGFLAGSSMKDVKFSNCSFVYSSRPMFYINSR